MAETVFPKPLDQDVGELAYLKNYIKHFSSTFTLQIPVLRPTWMCGLLIYNTAGGGDGLVFIYTMNNGTTNYVKLASNSGEGTIISGTASNGVLTLQAKSGSTSLRFDYATWIGIC